MLKRKDDLALWGVPKYEVNERCDTASFNVKIKISKRMFALGDGELGRRRRKGKNPGTISIFLLQSAGQAENQISAGRSIPNRGGSTIHPLTRRSLEKNCQLVLMLA